MKRSFTTYPSSYVKASDVINNPELYIYGIKWDISEQAFIDKVLKMPSRVVSRFFGYSSYGRRNEAGKIEFLADAYRDQEYLIPELLGLPEELELPANIPADFKRIDNYLLQTYGFDAYGYTIITEDADGNEVQIPYKYY